MQDEAKKGGDDTVHSYSRRGSDPGRNEEVRRKGVLSLPDSSLFEDGQKEESPVRWCEFFREEYV